MAILQPSLVITAALCLVLLRPVARAEGPCAEGWRVRRRRLWQARRRWRQEAPSPGCYSMTIKLDALCYGCDQARNVTVVNGAIQGPNRRPKMPTVAELFNQVDRRCFAECPANGPDMCTIEYHPRYGYITEFKIDIYSDAIDDESKYTISKLTFCD